MDPRTGDPGPGGAPSGDACRGGQPMFPHYLCQGCGRQTASLLPPPQAQVSNFKRENEALRSGQGASLAVVKQNTDVALQNLRVVMNNAHSSIKCVRGCQEHWAWAGVRLRLPAGLGGGGLQLGV